MLLVPVGRYFWINTPEHFNISPAARIYFVHCFQFGFSRGLAPNSDMVSVYCIYKYSLDLTLDWLLRTHTIILTVVTMMMEMVMMTIMMVMVMMTMMMVMIMATMIRFEDCSQS